MCWWVPEDCQDIIVPKKQCVVQELNFFVHEVIMDKMSFIGRGTVDFENAPTLHHYNIERWI